MTTDNSAYQQNFKMRQKCRKTRNNEKDYAIANHTPS